MSETSVKKECNFRYVSARNCRHCKYMPERVIGVKYRCQLHKDITLPYPDGTVCDDFIKSDRYDGSYWRERNE